MGNTFNKKQLGLAAACALALGVLSATAQAQGQNEHALVTSADGAPLMSGFGLCVRNGFGPAPAWTAGCHDYKLVQYVVPAQAKAVPPEQAEAPAAMPASSPAAVVVAAPLVWETVTFDANILFDSDKSTLRPLGRDKLEYFAKQIHGLESQNIVAIGYADRMGTSDSNQLLSQQRVDAVKSYLVGTGIATDRVQTRARGETQPTTVAGECKDAKNTKNVACMQPDRHVFIEVSGTRLVK
jgi:OmpA-OmpF porin, OOP family